MDPADTGSPHGDDREPGDGQPEGDQPEDGEHEDGEQEDGEHEDDLHPPRALLPPEDRIWRHPSELRPAATGSPPPVPAGAGWGVALVSGLIGAVLTVSLLAVTGALWPDTPRDVIVRETVAPPVNVPAAVIDPGGIVTIAERARPAITRVSARTPQGLSSGSGVLFRSDGHLLTNSHVVEDATSITVVLASGDELDAVLVGSDSLTDIAVLRIDAEGPFPTAILGSAAHLKIGQAAIAMGSPLGLVGGPSVTVGVISALGRRVGTSGRPALLDMIQTDAPIAPGSSGGALLDGSGAVIGITTAVAVSGQGGEGFGFATPIDVARVIADQIISTGRVVHVWLGVQGTDLDRATAAELGVRGGALVEEVLDDTPAARVGIRRGDVIVSVAGRRIESISELVVALRDHSPGDTVELVYYRETMRSTVSVRLAERPADL